ncbi:MAG: hypothetical protein ACT4P6_01135 [Gemmatimonadaceae bacterium]
MRATLFCFAALSLIAAAASAQGADSATAYTRTAEFRFGALMASTKRAASGATGAVAQAQTSLKGVEFLARATGGAALVARYETGTLPGSSASPATGKFEIIDGHVLLGDRSLALIAGYMLRTSALSGDDKQLGLARAGLHLARFFPGAGFEVSLNGSYVRTPVKDKVDSLIADGIEGQTALTYIPERVPLYVQLAYRRETFNLKRDDLFIRREEVSKLILTIGVQYGLSVR